MATKPLAILLICSAGAAAALLGWGASDGLLFHEQPAVSQSADDIAGDHGNISVLVKKFASPNREGKRDRDDVAAAPDAPPLRTSLSDNGGLDLSQMPPPMVPVTPLKGQKPSRAYLNDMQIAGLKKRLNLTRAQEKYWTPVEAALRGTVNQFTDYQNRMKTSHGAAFDFESADIRKLKISAKALYAQLRSDQKSQVMTLATMAGIGPMVAAVVTDKPPPKEPAKETPKEAATEE